MGLNIKYRSSSHKPIDISAFPSPSTFSYIKYNLPSLNLISYFCTFSAHSSRFLRPFRSFSFVFQSRRNASPIAVLAAVSTASNSQYAVLAANTEPPAPSPAPIKRRPVFYRPLPAESILRQVKTVCHFISEENNVLAFTGGDVLDVLKESDDGWEARLSGKVGIVPPDYVETI